jgi:hypothetical protein
MFITGAVDLLKRHSGKVWDPGRFAVFLRGEDARTKVGRRPEKIVKGDWFLLFVLL